MRCHGVLCHHSWLNFLCGIAAFNWLSFIAEFLVRKDWPPRYLVYTKIKNLKSDSFLWNEMKKVPPFCLDTNFSFPFKNYTSVGFTLTLTKLIFRQPKMGDPFLFPLHESRFLQKYFYQIIIFVLNWYNSILINMVILKINSVLLKVKNADIMTCQK